MPRFVILHHSTENSEHPRSSHWDLMFDDPAADDQSALRTWALEKPPSAGQLIQATPLPAHRRHYLDYEGPISGNRGTVRRWDAGEYECLEHKANSWRFHLVGRRVVADLCLRQEQGDWTAHFLNWGGRGQ